MKKKSANQRYMVLTAGPLKPSKMKSKQHNELIDSILQQNLETWVKHGLDMTVDLVRLDAEKLPDGFCSGFFVERSQKLFLLSAGHGLGEGQWYLQTHVADHTANQTVNLPLNGVFTLKKISLPPEGAAKIKSIDFAWCEVSFAQMAADMKQKPFLIEEKGFLRYSGPLDTEPVRDVPYTYAAHNQLLLLKAGRNFLEQGASYESFMEYDGATPKTGLYRFKLSRKHQGHSYYEGASGSPIFAPDGTIVSILLGGNSCSDVLYGLPLKSFEACVGLNSSPIEKSKPVNLPRRNPSGRRK